MVRHTCRTWGGEVVGCIGKGAVNKKGAAKPAVIIVRLAEINNKPISQNTNTRFRYVAEQDTVAITVVGDVHPADDNSYIYIDNLSPDTLEHLYSICQVSDPPINMSEIIVRYDPRLKVLYGRTHANVTLEVSDIIQCGINKYGLHATVTMRSITSHHYTNKVVTTGQSTASILDRQPVVESSPAPMPSTTYGTDSYPFKKQNVDGNIAGGSYNQTSVAIMPFSIANIQNGLPTLVNPADVVTQDLGRSGYFKLLSTSDVGVPPSDPSSLRLASWKDRGADAVVIGQVRQQGDDRIEVRFWLFDPVRHAQLIALSYTTTTTGLSAVAHRISDAIHQALLGEPGAYSGRIAYILNSRGRYEIQMADADGQNAVTVTSSSEPIITPTWSPDSKRLAYASFENIKYVVYIQNLADGYRRAVADFPGSIMAPAWSPDGSLLAVVLSKDEHSQIHLLNLVSSEVTRFSKNGAEENEPVFSKDGKWLYFISDRGGTPQVYRARLDGDEAQQVTGGGGARSPTISPDGRSIAFIQRREDQSYIEIMDIETKRSQILTEAGKYESPSFANNGRIILYGEERNGHWGLAMVSVDGRIQQRLPQSGEFRHASYGP